jgi:predicted ATPase/DNA-binding CsgD family transcriptional regulator
VKTAVPQHPADNLPTQPTPFIGRGEELDELRDTLADPDCRLLTLVGPGGSGKTRLSIEAAREMAGEFADGVYFVALQPVDSTEFLVPAIADAMKFSLRGQEEPRVQLSNYLGEKQLLLVLDNFEHLVGAADLVSDMLATAPNVKLLVSTREALNLREESIFPVPGMRFYDAVQLFVQHARRVKRSYSPEEDWGEIARLYQLVQGMPLGIELAASWVRVMPCHEIVAEIERNLDFLASSVRNMPERHRSMRAVFEESWRLLADEERDVFRRLSVLRGSFGREAAEKIADATLLVLSALVDKSLLKPHPNGRYQIHELLRQYACEKLEESPEEVARVHSGHCSYYADFLHERSPDLLGGRQLEAGREIEAELENIRAAWQWAVEEGKVEELRNAAQTFAQFCQFKSRYTEAAAALEKAVTSLDKEEATEDVNLTLALVLVHLGWFHIRLGRLDEAEEVLRRCYDIRRSLSTPPVAAFATEPLLALGIIATIRGDYPEAARLGEEGRLTSEAQGDTANRQLAYYVLTRAALLQGQNEVALGYAQQARDIATETGDRWFLAYCLIELGSVTCALGDPAAAREHYQASYDLRKEFEDPEGMAVALNYLGEVALQQQSYVEAQNLYQRAISNYEDIHDRGGLAASLTGLAKAAVALEDYEAAREHFQRALQLAVDIQHLPQVLSIVTGTGEMLFGSGEPERGLELLILTQNHLGSDHETRSWAQRLLTRYADGLKGDSAIQPNGTSDLEKATLVLQETLGVTGDLGIRDLLDCADTAASQSPGGRAHPDDLTDREVEVLRLIAQGKSNRQIAEDLFITTNTAANHIKNIFSKTQSANRTEAATYAIAKGLV